MEADVSTYVPKGSFDAIIFCEVLNYFSDPLAVVKNYESALNKDGIFIVSILHNVWKKSIWKVLEKEYRILTETKSTRGNTNG